MEIHEEKIDNVRQKIDQSGHLSTRRMECIMQCWFDLDTHDWITKRIVIQYQQSNVPIFACRDTTVSAGSQKTVLPHQVFTTRPVEYLAGIFTSK